MDLKNLVKKNKDMIHQVAKNYGAKRIRLFGSVVRGQSTDESDIDLLVEMSPGATLLDIVAIKQDLEDLLNRRIDVVTEASLSPYIHDAVLKEAVPL